MDLVIWGLLIGLLGLVWILLLTVIWGDRRNDVTKSPTASSSSIPDRGHEFKKAASAR